MNKKHTRKIALSLAIDILSTRPIGELIDEEYPDLSASESLALEKQVKIEMSRIVETLKKWKGE